MKKVRFEGVNGMSVLHRKQVSGLALMPDTCMGNYFIRVRPAEERVGQLHCPLLRVESYFLFVQEKSAEFPCRQSRNL